MSNAASLLLNLSQKGYAAEGCWHQFLQVSSSRELQEAKWLQSSEAPDPWGECREAPDPCISMALEVLTASGRVRGGPGGSAGLSCMAVLPSGHRLNQERIAHPLAALHLVCTVSKYLGKQQTWLRADFPFQGKFGSCSVLQLIFTGIRSFITIFCVTVSGRFHYGSFIIHTQLRRFEFWHPPLFQSVKISILNYFIRLLFYFPLWLTQ